MQYTAAILAAAGLLTTVTAHGFITDPLPRLAGNAMKAACGEQVYNNQASDTYGNIQGELQVAASQRDYNAAACNIWLCKGFKFDDNTANVHSYTAGQVVPIKFDLRAPHAGTANVSIVNTATNSIIGKPLVTYSDFGNNAYTTPANQTSFSITIPSDLPATCSTPGACVIQHWWDAASISQTYESCIDFVVGGGAGTPPAASSSAVASAAPTSAPAVSAAPTSAPVATSAPAAPTTLLTLARPASSATKAVVAPSATAEPTPVPAPEVEDCQ